KHGTERVLIAYDRDTAGDKAAEKLSRELVGMGIEVRRVLFPKGMDANEYALKLDPVEKSLRLALQNAEWMGGSRPSGEWLVGSGQSGAADARRGEGEHAASRPEPTDKVQEKAIKEESEPTDDEVAKPTSAVADVNARSTESPTDAPLEHAESAILKPSFEAVEEETFPHLAAQGAVPAATESEASQVARKVSSS